MTSHQKVSSPIAVPVRPTPLAQAVQFSLMLMGTAGFATLALTPASAMAQVAQERQSYSIGAGDLGPALSQFAIAAQVTLSMDPTQTRGLKTEGLQGRFTVQEGFATVLSGSGLEASRQPNGSYVLRKPAGAATVLPSVTVQAKAQQGLPADYAGGPVARGGRLGLLGNSDIMDSPFNTTSFTEQGIKDRQANTLADVVANDPSVRSVGKVGDVGEALFIRGFPIGDQNSGEIAFDGVYGVAPNYRILTDYAERIEILKGPGALLYGMSPASSVGGTINIVPKRAGAADLTRLTANYSLGSQFGGQVDISRRFGEEREFGVRFNSGYQDGDTALDKQSRTSLVNALSLDYKTKTVRASLDILDQQEDITAPTRRPFLATGVAVPSAPDGRRNVSQPWEWFKTRDQSVLAKVEYDINDNLTLMANAGKGQSNVDRLFGNPTIQNAAGDTTTTPQHFKFDVERSTVDVGLRSRFATGEVAHSLVFQLSRYDDTLSRNSVNGTAVLSNIYSPLTQAAQDVAAPATVPRVSDTRLSGIALADTLAMMDDKLLLTFGVREQRVESKSYSVTGTTTAVYDESALTPLAGVVFKPWSGVSLYANYIEGLSKGDVAPASATNAGEVFAPYKSRQHELGVKFDFGNLAATVSAFEISKPSGSLNGGVYSVNGEQRNQGLEFMLFGQATRELRLFGGVTLIDGELTKTNSAATLGNTAVGVPSVQANLLAEWSPAVLQGVTLTGAIAHSGKQYVNQANTLSIPAWTTADLGARYKATLFGKVTTYRMNVQNVFDKNYWAGVSQYSSLALGAPRTLSLSATMDF